MSDPGNGQGPARTRDQQLDTDLHDGFFLDTEGSVDILCQHHFHVMTNDDVHINADNQLLAYFHGGSNEVEWTGPVLITAKDTFTHEVTKAYKLTAKDTYTEKVTGDYKSEALANRTVKTTEKLKEDIGGDHEWKVGGDVKIIHGGKEFKLTSKDTVQTFIGTKISAKLAFTIDYAAALALEYKAGLYASMSLGPKIGYHFGLKMDVHHGFKVDIGMGVKVDVEPAYIKSSKASVASSLVHMLI